MLPQKIMQKDHPIYTYLFFVGKERFLIFEIDANSKMIKSVQKNDLILLRRVIHESVNKTSTYKQCWFFG